MFVWTSIAHMALPLGEAGINEIPNESAVLNAMQSSMGDNAGLYIFPHPSGALCCVRHSAGRGKLTNARVDDHIYARGLICHYCERLRRRADVPAPAVLAHPERNLLEVERSDIFHVSSAVTCATSVCLSRLKMTSG